MTTYAIEHTDTFSGEPNYSWVRRFTVEAYTRLELIRRVKKQCGLAGLRCDVYDSGEDIEIRPSHVSEVVFITEKEEEVLLRTKNSDLPG